MATLLPVLVLLLLTGAETGWFSWRSHQVGRAAQRGVEVAATQMATTALVEVAVTDALRRAGLGESDFRTEFAPPGLDAAPGAPVTVTVSVSYPLVSLSVLGHLPFLPRRLERGASLPKEAPHFGPRPRTLAFAP